MNTEIFTDIGRYLMLAFDHRDSFRKLIDPNNPDSVKTEDIIKSKKDIISVLKNSFSGILVDPEYGLEALRSLEVKTPYLLPAEESGSTLINGEKINVIERSASELKNYGASGVKLLLYFNPKLESARHQIKLAKTVLEDAHKNELPLFLEIVTYGIQTKDRVVESVQMFLKNGVIPDVFKIEYPGSNELCREITKMLGITPWIILTRGGDYNIFKEQLITSSKNGCRGFLAGRSIWQDYITEKDLKKKEIILKETIPARFEEIRRISTDI